MEWRNHFSLYNFTKLCKTNHLAVFHGFVFAYVYSKNDFFCRFTVSMLKAVCDVLDLEKNGTKDSVVARIIDFLFCPKSSGKALPQSKKQKRKHVYIYKKI